MQTTQSSKHEIIRCERCSAPFECKANKFTQCQCSAVAMTINEVQYVSELYDAAFAPVACAFYNRNTPKVWRNQTLNKHSNIKFSTFAVLKDRPNVPVPYNT